MLISVPISLLALAGGMLLLAKSNRDNLGLFFKIVSYFIIVASFIVMACAGMHTMLRFYSNEHGAGDRMMMHGNYEKKMYKKFMKQGMGFNHWMMRGNYNNACTCRNNCYGEGSCCGEGQACNRNEKKDKCEMKGDSCNKKGSRMN